MCLPFCCAYIIESTTDVISELHNPTSLTTSSKHISITSEINATTGVILELHNSTSPTTNSNLESVGATCKDSQCANIALTTGVVSIIVTGLLVASISVAIHIAVYHYVYKPKLRSSAPCAGLTDDVDRCDGATVYDVVNERIETSLEMKQNEAYGLTRSN